jgi:hypothetical protein
MSIIKCYKMECEVCKVTGTAQLFFNKANQLRYGRVRHYIKLNADKKPMFEYHAQSREYLIEKLRYVIPQVSQPCDPKQNNLDQDVDQNLKDSNIKLEIGAPAGIRTQDLQLTRLTP